MKLGLLTAALPNLTLEEVAEWAATNGFEMLEVACWPSATGERRPRLTGGATSEAKRDEGDGEQDRRRGE